MFLFKPFKKNRKKYFLGVIFLLSLSAYFIFGFYHITKFVTADEHYWLYERVPQYWDSLRSKNLKDTLINDKPGITVALVSGAGLFFEPNPENHMKNYGEGLVKYDYNNTENIYFKFRAPIIIFNAVLLIYIFWILKKLFSFRVASLSIIGISLSPILIGISQIVNPDALLWSLSFCSIISYFALLETAEKKFIFLTGLFLGLSMITKYAANFIYPFLFFLFLIFPIFKECKRDEILKYFKNQLSFYWSIVLVSFFTIAIFLPAVIVKPIYFYRLTIGFESMPIIWSGILLASFFLILECFLNKIRAILFLCGFFKKIKIIFKIFPLAFLLLFFSMIALRGIYPGEKWELFQKMPFDFKNIFDGHLDFFSSFLLQINPLVFSITPIVILGLVAVIFWGLKSEEKNIFYIFSLVAFIILFEIASIFSGILNTVRYSVILIPILVLLSSLGWESFLKKMSKSDYFNFSIITIIFLFSVGITFNAKPFYFNYTNALLSKKQLVSDAWGYGGYEAAQFLNRFPDSENLIVWSDYYGFCEFFKGICIRNFKFDQKKYPVDYYVFNRRGEIIYNEKAGHWNEENFSQAFHYNKRNNPIWNLEIGGREKNYIKIFKAD